MNVTPHGPRAEAWVIDGPRGATKILVIHPNTLRSRMKKRFSVRARPIPKP
jgi:hypothetical protein